MKKKTTTTCPPVFHFYERWFKSVNQMWLGFFSPGWSGRYVCAWKWCQLAFWSILHKVHRCIPPYSHTPNLTRQGYKSAPKRLHKNQHLYQLTVRIEHVSRCLWHTLLSRLILIFLLILMVIVCLPLKKITGASFFNPLAAKNLNCLAIKTANSAGT